MAAVEQTFNTVKTIGGTLPLFVRYKDGSKIFGMSEREFIDLSKRAGAVHKIGRMALVNTVIV